MSDLGAFLPKSCRDLLGEGAGTPRAWKRAEGSVLFCDVAGFTPLTEALLVLGREGSEELTRLLNDYFTCMVGLVEEGGGDVLRFGGDAMTVLFPGRSRAGAARTARLMMGAMARFTNMPTRAGAFSLSMKIGAAHGSVALGLLSAGDTWDFYAAGSPLDEAAAAEHHAVPGQIVCAPSFLTGAAGQFAGERVGTTSFVLLGGGTGKPTSRPSYPVAPSEKALRRVVPPYLQEEGGRGKAGEHRGVAVLFASLAGLSDVPAGKEQHEALQRVFRVLVSAARKYGGVVNKLDMGDKGAKGLLLFGAPYAIEHREEMALRAAMDLTDARDLPAGIAACAGVTSSNLFTGPVGSDVRREYTVMGDGINLAARLMQAAGRGQVLCEAACARRAARALRFKDLDFIRVKGKKIPVHVMSPEGEVEHGAEGTQVLVEREGLCAELETLLKEGFGRAAVLTGAAGVGKTALLDHLLQKATEAETPSHKLVLAPFSLERAYAVWRSPLRAVAGVKRGDSPASVGAARDRAFGSEPAGYRVLVNPLLDLPEEPSAETKNLSAKERKDLLFAMLGRLFRSAGRRVILCDNLQHADPLSLEFMEFLLGDAEGAPWTFVGTVRTGGEAVVPRGLEELPVPPLSEAGLEELLGKVHGLTDAPREVLAWFAERSRGNPALVRALVAAVDSAGLLTRDEHGARVDQDRLFKTAFPDTLEGLYLARTDRLAAREREVLRFASILGSSVSINLLHQVSGLRMDELMRALKTLKDTGLLVADTWGKRPYVRFADALLRDAVYGALPFAFKREGHLNLARFLDVDAEANARLWPGLAHHYEQGGDDTKARKYHRLAGRDAFARYDNVTALKHLEFVCARLTADEQDVEDAFSLMEVYGFLAQWPSLQPVVQRLGDLGEALSLVHKARLRYYRARVAYQDHHLDATEQLLREGLSLYGQAKDLVGMGKSYVNLVGLVYGPTGRLEEARDCLEAALTLHRGPGQEVFRVLAAMNLGAVEKHLGHLESAEGWFRTAARWSSKWKLGPQKGMIFCNLAGLSYERGDFLSAARWSRKAVAALETFAIRSVLLNARQILAVSSDAIGETEEARAILEAVHRQAILLGHYEAHCLAHQGLGHVALLHGQAAEFLALSEEALEGFRTAGNAKDYLATLGEILDFYLALDLRNRAEAFWRHSGVDSFLADHEGSPALGRMRAWISGTGLQEDDVGREINSLPPEEVMERRSWACAVALWHGDTRTARRALSGAWRALPRWPFFGARVRLLFLDAVVRRTVSRERGREAGLLLNRNIGGIWGVRLSALLAQSPGLTQKGKKQREIALERLFVVQKNSPEWVWDKLASMPEVRAVLE